MNRLNEVSNINDSITGKSYTLVTGRRARLAKGEPGVITPNSQAAKERYGDDPVALIPTDLLWELQEMEDWMMAHS